MKYDPRSADDQLLPEGKYELEICSAEEKTSKAGNDMMHIRVKAFAPSRDEVFMDDYFVADHPAGQKRLQKLCAALGLDYSKGEITPADLKGKFCRGHVKINRSDNPAWPDKNVVAYYLPPERGAAPRAQPPASQPEEEPPAGIDVPF